MKNREFRINIVLPVLLFFIFALAGLWVVTASLQIFRQEQEESGQNASSRILSDYVAEKIRQADPGTVSIGALGDSQALLLAQKEEGIVVYIYLYEGQLMEQYVPDDADVHPEGGTEIAPAAVFRLETPREGLLKVTCSVDGGHMETDYVTTA